ncbi:MAG: hypothetical protein HYZ75_19805 [Elusimicrobia bacterium]|nr:hypothetical protein [Elusimicrobiota bacterium]
MVHTVLGSSWLPSWFLSALCPALSRGMSVRWIDAGHDFDGPGLDRTARYSGADPRRVMGRVQLERPSDPFQLEVLLRHATLRGAPTVVSDPLALLYDERLPEEDAKRAAPRLAKALKELPADCVVLSVSRHAPPSRLALGEAVLAASDRVVTLREEDGPLSLATLGCEDLTLAAC